MGQDRADVGRWTARAIAQLMVGRELSSLYPNKHEPDVDEEIVLSVKGLSTGSSKMPASN